jgi:hypothetical protein
MALAGVAMAQQANEEASPGKKKQQGAEHTQAAHQQPNANAARPHATPVPGHATTSEQATGKGHKTHQESATAQETNVSGQPAGSASRSGERHQKGMKEHAAKISPTPAAAAASAAPAVSTATQKGQAGQANVAAGAKKKPDQQQVQQIKAQHANFRAQPKPQQVPAVTYNQNYRIQGSESWQGPQYEVFRAYRPEWHDEGWYRSRYPRVELIGGGYYYWNSGYWYPAYGYDPVYSSYEYDGPIYGYNNLPPGQVVTNVQSALQQQGYYRGEIDGSIGPVTRSALRRYQRDNGLRITAAIDRPTLASLGMI